MTVPYAKKVKLDTTKQMVKSMLRTPKGKTVTDAKFNKEFLKKDKELRKYYLKPKNATLKASEAKAFVNKALKSADATGKMKISRQAAKKMGIRINKQGEVGAMSMKKLYKNIVTEDRATMATPNEPSPQELRQQKRHENALKTLHKRDRAEDIRKDPNLDRSQTDDNKQQSGEKKQSPSAPPQRASSGSSVPASGSQLNDQSASGIKSAGGSVGTSSQSASHSTDSDPIPLLIYPLYNLTPNVDGLDVMTKKITNTVAQVLNTESSFQLLPVDSWKKALSALRLETRPLITEESNIQTLAREAGAQLITVGSVTQKGITTDIIVKLMNVETGQQMVIATIHSESRDLFQIEKNIRWQINDTLRGKAESSQTNKLPNPDDLTELPL